MSKTFIDKVRSIVINNISDEKFGVRELASVIGLSTAHTLRKVRAETGKSVNQYIRELRLEEAAKLIKKTDATFSEISYQVGFSSPSYFNKAFSKYYGISPGDYKTKSISLKELAANKPEIKPQTFITRKQLFYVTSIVLVLLIGFFLIKNYTTKSTSLPNSIAVLPLKDFSPEDSQWFSDGVSDNILHSLAQMQDLSVISFTSSSTYRDSDKKIPQIAKELGVSYILEGSVTLYEDKIKIITQLIDANDTHIWSKEYNESFDDIISVQNDVAQEVLKQLRITLNPQEEKVLNKNPTENMEAYSLYLKAQNLMTLNGYTKKNLDTVIVLYKQAISLDSTFADAYASLAGGYYVLSHFYSIEIDPLYARNKALYYSNMALKVDSTTHVAWAIKGGLLEYKDWDKAKKYYEKALSINPNDAIARVFYAIYYIYRPDPDIKKSLEHQKIAQRLAPLSNIVANNYFGIMLKNEKIEEAEEFFERNKFLFSEGGIINKKQRIIAYKNKDWTTVLPFMKANMEKFPENTMFYREMAKYYDQVLNDDKNAIKFAKKGYAIDSTNSSNLNLYIRLLVENKDFNEAKRLMESQNYKSIVNNRAQLHSLFNYYYQKGDKQKTLEISKDSLFKNQYWHRTLTYAQVGDRRKVDSMNKKYPWGTGRQNDWRYRKAVLFAVSKDTDSMYFYLNNILWDKWAHVVNGSHEFDPYRNEERFKALLRKWYLPVPED